MNIIASRSTGARANDSCTGRVRERLHTEYLQLSHESISRARATGDADPVWQAFY